VPWGKDGTPAPSSPIAEEHIVSISSKLVVWRASLIVRRAARQRRDWPRRRLLDPPGTIDHRAQMYRLAIYALAIRGS
jgi:hypothetical protein